MRTPAIIRSGWWVAAAAVIVSAVTAWIVIGTMLEERDLVATIGPEYRAYQRSVPMLLPLRIPSPPK